ncbi:hypothetical protein [Enterococcus gallinarum]|uniref:hypothetical protein n=1 Tax=Enterococcus gallinarum TaxID=1353 RepID=UPI001AD6DFCE|nr:hypothetical protein [Enterococcus gallinarum]MBO6417332.1 hypothetical protein [Enterococcus gallinarum]MBO6423423.1 hypothetical protein [Enterococcus gallinarum]
MAVYEVKVEDHSAVYLAELSAEIRNASDDLGYDLQSVARQAAPEKTGNLVKHILVKSSAANGAYQVDLESTAVDPTTGNDYVDWMHNGSYRLGKKSKSKGMASSRIGKFRKRVGTNYLAGSGELAIAGYQSYMEKRISAVNSKYAE